MSILNTSPSKILKSPPLGWNSWDCFGASITEEELLQNAEYVQEHLLSHGFEYITLDIQWSEPLAHSWDYNAYTPLTLDAYGRQLPAENRFPSAKAGQGLLPIANKTHAMGLKFGVHLMRGIPRQAVHSNLPILGTDYTARDAVHRQSICAWNTDMYGLNHEHPAAQAYYDSVFDLFATWEVDYVKVDDIAWNFMHEGHYHAKEVEMIHRAIEKSGRQMVLSLSPGPAVLSAHTHMEKYANCWRITDDFWDDWSLVLRAFTASEAWQGMSGHGAWPDCDMLPFGRLRMRHIGPDGQAGENHHLDDKETFAVYALWCLMRSPLILGGHLPESDPRLLTLYKNEALLAWNQEGGPSYLLSNPGADVMVWTQEKPSSSKTKAIPLLFINRSEKDLTYACDEAILLIKKLYEQESDDYTVEKIMPEAAVSVLDPVENHSILKPHEAHAYNIVFN